MQDSDPVSLTYGQLTDMVDRIKAGSVTFKPYPSTVNTSGTTAQFIASIQALNAGVGMAFLGTVTLSDLPGGLTQEEVEAYVYDDNLIYCICRSADTAPYSWWCASYQYAGWQPTDTTYSAFAGATAQQAGTAGLVPAPTTSDPDKFLKGDGTWGTPTNTTYSDFTGTDGTSAGASGLVPAPATTDAGKFLKADGTWDTAGGSNYTAGDGIDITNAVISATNTGKFKALTFDDENWPTANPNGIAMWLLPDGIYSNPLNIGIYTDSISSSVSLNFFIKASMSTYNFIYYTTLSGGSYKWYFVETNSSGAWLAGGLMTPSVEDRLNATSSTSALSANQGRVLKDLIDSIAIRGAGAPTTSTVGEVGQLYEDGTNGTLYQLKSIDITVTPNTYNWEQVGGSSVTAVQTTGTSTTDVMSQNATTSMVYADPSTRTKIQIGDGAIVGSGTNQSNGIAIGTGASSGDNSASVSYGAIALGRQATPGPSGVAIGNQAYGPAFNSGKNGTIALGHASGDNITASGMMDIGSRNTSYGYNSSNYRLLSGLYDPQSAHDAATKGYVDGTTETYAIATSDWSALSASSPYDYQSTVTATYTIGANTIAELLNDSPVDFANHGFAIGNISSQSVTIYSIGVPSASVSLKINYKG